VILINKGRGPFIITNTIRLLLVGSIVWLIINHGIWGEILQLFVISGCLALTYLPSIIARQWKIYLPIGLQFTIIFFVFASMFLGEIHDFYYHIPWWDTMLHAMSGIILGIVGFILTYTLNNSEYVEFSVSPFYVCLFSFTFALAAGAVWERFEYCMDLFYGFNMQKDGLNDTMKDIIIDALSALGTAVWGYFYIYVSNKGTPVTIKEEDLTKEEKKKMLL